MCDTMVALGNSTKDGSVIFAKNSDRQPNEPHIMVRIPRKKHSPGEKLKCTYIEIDQAEETFEVFLLMPSWIWGCEMGCNEFGLNIGNEAVFTKEKCGKDSLIGMDMIRIALERCRTSDEALDMMINLLGRYGQGGNCGYKKRFTYHNSFLIADSKSAWVLETAGEYWAAEKVKDIRSISNCISIENKFDKCHPDLIKHAVEKGWCKGEKDFNFAGCYSDPLVTKLSGARSRQSMSMEILEREKGSITMNTMKSILRSHEENVEGKQFTRHSLKGVCMHGGFIYGDHTTGSYAASIRDGLCTYMVTGASTPCIAVFKPLWLIGGEPLTFNEDEKNQAVEYWRKRELFHRMIVDGRVSSIDSYYEMRDEIENEIDNMIGSINFDSSEHDKLIEIMKYAMQKEEVLIEKMIKSNLSRTRKPKGWFYYRQYWKKQNKNLNI